MKMKEIIKNHYGELIAFVIELFAIVLIVSGKTWFGS